MTYVLGVDGGTSKTKALISLPDGTIVGSARSGGSNVYEGDPALGLANAMLAPEQALTMAGIPADALSTSAFSMSGADWPEDITMFRAKARSHGYGVDVHVMNDAIGGMYAGLPGPCCVAIICGTHAACAARGAGGELWHNSFWQMVGGAHDLGSAGLRAVYQSDLGIIGPTSLTTAILEFFSELTAESLLHRQTALFAEPLPDVALLASLVIDHAEAGDSVARAIVARQGQELARYGLAAARKVGIEHVPFDLVLGGSVFRHSSTVLPEAIATVMREASPHVNVLYRSHEPVVGALLIALERHGVTIDDTIIARVIATLPEGWY